MFSSIVVSILLVFLIQRNSGATASDLAHRLGYVIVEASKGVNHGTEEVNKKVASLANQPANIETALESFYGESDNLVKLFNQGVDDINKGQGVVSPGESAEVVELRDAHALKVVEITNRLTIIGEVFRRQDRGERVVQKLKQQKLANERFSQVIIRKALERHKIALESSFADASDAYGAVIFVLEHMSEGIGEYIGTNGAEILMFGTALTIPPSPAFKPKGATQGWKTESLSSMSSPQISSQKPEHQTTFSPPTAHKSTQTAVGPALAPVAAVNSTATPERTITRTVTLGIRKTLTVTMSATRSKSDSLIQPLAPQTSSHPPKL
jgi:hypothetical protein